MSEAAALLLLGALGVLAAFVERRDGLRLADHQGRTDRELADLRERVSLLEHRLAKVEDKPGP